MAHTEKANLSHEERTATEPRNEGRHPVILDRITRVNDRIKTYRFNAKDPSGIHFLAGQWVDLHVPGIEKAGGFTITSPPVCAVPSPKDTDHKPYIELAVQKSPDNPPAAWLWQPEDTILGKELSVRVGGSFTWPPPGIDANKIERVVFIAGGVGINPLISMITDIIRNPPRTPSPKIHLIYSTKIPTGTSTYKEVLFLERIFELLSPSFLLELWVTGTSDGSPLPDVDSSELLDVPHYSYCDIWTGRIEKQGLRFAAGRLGKQDSTVCYVCGPPEMTDQIVKDVRSFPGVVPEHVLCEKWW